MLFVLSGGAQTETLAVSESTDMASDMAPLESLESLESPESPESLKSPESLESLKSLEPLESISAGKFRHLAPFARAICSERRSLLEWTNKHCKHEQ